ncbi:hypothetical protein K1T71_002205 [Dendrolimus kikuchii]|uniref:Uncharacterized protein n=1 Tax=Dendrolimus kikuchii TaxID=765133 RepID=A0ACC1DHI3_9NEOP|nr:hypothetical protein K1T71_002205 [Dendrolimus kikuchii]
MTEMSSKSYDFKNIGALRSPYCREAYSMPITFVIICLRQGFGSILGARSLNPSPAALLF